MLAVLPSALLAVAIILSVTGIGQAAWARHGVVGWETRSTKYPVAWEWSADKSRVKVFVPVREKDSSLGYFVVTAKERLPEDNLEFRRSMSRWRTFQERLERAKTDPRIAETMAYEIRHPESLQRHRAGYYDDVQRFETMYQIEPETRDGVRGIFLELEKDVALRTYLVYDFLPWGGSGIRDGGLWLTYDLPTFLERAEEKSSNALPKTGAQVRIRDLFVEEAADGSRTFRVRIEKRTKEFQGRWAVRFRIWERRPDGTLGLAKPANRPELDATLRPEWKESESRDVVLTWEGPDEGSGNAYYGCSVDVLCGSRIQDSRATSPDLLGHLLAVESMDVHQPNAPELACGIRPERIWYESRRMLERIPRQWRTEKSDSIREELHELIETLEHLKIQFPEWSSGDPAYGQNAGEVSLMLQQARQMQKELSEK